MPHDDSDSLTLPSRPHLAATVRTKATVRVLGWGGLIAVVLIAGTFFLTRERGRLSVEVVAVRRGAIVSTATSIATGTIESEREVQAAFQTAGVVAEVLASEGDKVTRGQILARLDDREARATYEVARANLAAATAEHARAVASRRVRETTSVTEQAAAEAEAGRATADLGRAKRLSEEGIASRQDLDRAEAESRAAEAGAEAARARGLDREIAGLDVTAAAARVDHARAALDAARVTLDRCTLLAPFDAVVTARHVQVGQTVAPVILATTPLFSLVDRSALYVRASFDETDAGRLRQGLAARLSLDAFPGHALEGSVSEVAPVVSTARLESRSVSVKIRFTGDTPGIIPGMSADAEVIFETKESVLLAPSDALMERGEQRSLYIADGGYARRIAVTTGLSNWDATEIVSGVAEGDLVIVSLDVPGLREDSAVRVAATRSWP